MHLKSLLKVSRTTSTWVLLTCWCKDSGSLRWRVDSFSPTKRKVYSRSVHYCYEAAYLEYQAERKLFGALDEQERKAQAKRFNKLAKQL